MKLRDMIDRRVELTDADGTGGQCYAEVLEDGVMVYFDEPWAWHAETFPDIAEAMGDGEGGLKAGAGRAIHEVAHGELCRHLAKDIADTLELWEGDGDELVLQFSIRFPAEILEETPESLEADHAWPFQATMLNITDPGTFGSPYVMGSALQKMEEES